MSSPTFVGRAEELAVLDAALGRAADADPAVVLVAGESGVGKSRLVAEFGDRARASGGRVLTGECIELVEGELPYAPIARILRALPEEELAELAGAARPELGPLLAEDPGDARPDDQFAQARMFDLLLSLFGRLGERAPLVLVIEDLHWADRSTRDFLTFAVRALRQEKLVLVATYRSDELHRRHPLRALLAELERLERAERVELGRFSRLELVALLTGILEQTPDGSLADALYSRSEGNAVFAEELLAAGGSDGRLPDTLRDALMVRVETLPEPSQELLRLAAAAGRSVTHRLLATVAGRGESELLVALREAVANHLLVQGEPGDTYAFRHALMREAICDDLLPGERSSIHLRLAEALSGDPSLSTEAVGPAAELAYHWQQAHDLPRALAASVEAGIQAERMRAPAEAAHQFENAIDVWDRVPDAEEIAGITLVELLQRAAERANLAGEPQRAAALARQALEHVADPRGAGLMRERLGRYLWLSGRDTDALEEYRHAVELVPAEPHTPDRARVLASLAQALMLLDDLPGSLELAREAVELARETGDRAVEAHALTTLGTDLAGLGARDEGIETMREALAIATDRTSPDDLQRTYVNLSDALDQAGRVEEAVALALEGVEAARRLGLGRGYTGFLLAEVARRSMRLGRVDDAERLSAQAIDESATGITEGLIRQTQAKVDLLRGRVGDAERNMAAARHLLDASVGSQWLAPLYASQCEVAVMRGELDEVRRLVDRVRERIVEAEEMGFFLSPLYVAAMLAEADGAQRARAHGDTEAEAEARRRSREFAARLAALGEGATLRGSAAPQVAADAALGAGELTRAEGDAQPGAWTDAIERFDALGNVLAAAYARMRQAEAHLERGEHAEAAEPLRAAHRAAAECGALPLRGDVEALAGRARIDLGVPAPVAADGGGSEAERLGLTAREAEVLALVAIGRTNRQIGEQLFISDKTASVHVSRILAKLGVAGRGEAAAVAHRLGLAGEQPVAGA